MGGCWSIWFGDDGHGSTVGRWRMARPVRLHVGDRGVTVYFVSRHQGAMEWARRQSLDVDRFVSHLDAAQVQPHDSVIGNLPVHLAAQVCSRGARYWHLSIDAPSDLRGTELRDGELVLLGASLHRFFVVAA